MATATDARNLRDGRDIPTLTYSDQPYIVQTDDGAWLCCVTTGAGREGEPGQTVATLRSTDQGRTWSAPVTVEPPDGPEASYAVMLKARSGRVYCFYNHNTDRVSEVKREDGGVYKRVDSLGHYVFKYSDDHGRSWSAQRYEVPVREFACDRSNVYGGSLRFFWNVGRPLVVGDVALLVLHKVGAMGAGFFAQSEGAFLRSRNILTEPDPAKVTFETLPLGDIGLRTPPGGGRVAEEQSVVALSDGSLYCVYRTVDGHPCCAYSRDGGETWSEPRYASYTPGGRRLKHPRAANFVWRCVNGHYLYWFHNHGGHFIRGTPEWGPYEDRNPVWLTGGVEVETPQGRFIQWAQPEIALYEDDTFLRISYPDLVEEVGHYYLSETQKNRARVHEVDPTLLAGLWGQFGPGTVVRQGLAVDLPAAGGRLPPEVLCPNLPAFTVRDHSRPDHGTRDTRAGLTLDLVLRLNSLAAGQVLLDNRTAQGKGFCLQTTGRGTVELVLNDGRSESRWESDPGRLAVRRVHEVTVIVDGGPKLILFVVDGVLCDGGEDRQFGWGRFSPHLRDVNGAPMLRLAPAVKGRVLAVRVYPRALRTSEAVGNWRALQAEAAG